MGFFDFVKGAGEKLFGKGDDAAEAAKADPAKPTFDPAFVADQLRTKVNKLGLPIRDLGVHFADGVATISGIVPSTEVAEKAVLQLGNTTVVERVVDQLLVQPASMGDPESVDMEAPTVETQAPVVTPPAVFYTVQKGDSLSKIAKTQYGDYRRYPEIFEANKPMLKDPDLIYPGQVLRIPQAPNA